MDKEKLLCELEKEKTRYQEILNEKTHKCLYATEIEYYEGARTAMYEAIYLAKKLDEPTHKPVEVEPFMADWLDSLEEREKGKDCLIYELVFAAVEDAEYELDQMEEWIVKEGNIFILADALSYGYVRKEPEKQWVVTQDGRYLESVFVGESENANTGFLLDKDKAIKFTDKAKAEVVATLVDGEVEEI